MKTAREQACRIALKICRELEQQGKGEELFLVRVGHLNDGYDLKRLLTKGNGRVARNRKLPLFAVPQFFTGELEIDIETIRGISAGNA